MNLAALAAGLIAWLSLSVATPALAQSTESHTANLTAQPAPPPAWRTLVARTNGHTARHLIAADGKSLGVLKDFVVDLTAGRIVDILTTIPSGSASDDRLVAVPWEVVRWKATPGTFVFVGEEADLQQAPRVPQKLWRHQSATRWTAAAHRYWQKKRGQHAAPPQGHPPLCTRPGIWSALPCTAKTGRTWERSPRSGCAPKTE